MICLVLMACTPEPSVGERDSAGDTSVVEGGATALEVGGVAEMLTGEADVSITVANPGTYPTRAPTSCSS